MNGVFLCPACHSLKSVDDGWFTQMAHPAVTGQGGVMAMFIDPEAAKPEPRIGLHVTPIILCDSCLPHGVAAVPVREVETL